VRTVNALKEVPGVVVMIVEKPCVRRGKSGSNNGANLANMEEITIMTVIRGIGVARNVMMIVEKPCVRQLKSA
jgi:hypothetical protein